MLLFHTFLPPMKDIRLLYLLYHNLTPDWYHHRYLWIANCVLVFLVFPTILLADLQFQFLVTIIITIIPFSVNLGNWKNIKEVQFPSLPNQCCLHTTNHNNNWREKVHYFLYSIQFSYSIFQSHTISKCCTCINLLCTF